MQSHLRDDGSPEGLEAIRARVGHSILDRLDAQVCHRILPAGTPLSIEDGTISVVRDGRVAVHLRGKPLLILEPGDVVGPWLGSLHQLMVAGHEHPATLIEYNDADFLSFITSNPVRHGTWTSYVGAICSSLACRVSEVMPRPQVLPKPHHRYFAAGDVLIRQGDHGEEVFALREGSAEVLVNGVKVGQISAGETFGAMASLTGQARCATVVALQHGTLMSFKRSEFEDLMKSHPEVMLKLVDDMAKTIKSLNEKILDLADVAWRTR